MADSLYFTAPRSVTAHTGTNLQLMIPPRGGNTWQFPQWWDKKQTVQYIDCAIFKITDRSGADLRLVVPIDPANTELSILYQADDNFVFGYYRGVRRVAVVPIDATDVLVEYQFPAISAGSILKRTITPLPGPSETITGVTVTGSQAVVAGVATTYSASITGTATGVTYSYSTNDSGATVNGADITFSLAGTFSVTAVATKAGATGSGTAGTLSNVVVSAPPTLGTVTVTGPATAAVDETKTYAAAISGDATQLTYLWEVPGINGTIQSGQGTASCQVTFNGADTVVPACTVTASDPGLTGPSSASGSISVVVS